MALLPTWHTQVLRAVAPSFVDDLLFPDRATTAKVHPTSYLDGLRGLASVIVFFCHFTEENHHYLLPPYGLNPDQSPSSWIQLPFLRIIFSGRPMVHIFFVISGFVLSYKPIKAIHAGNFEKCFSLLSSSTFRRAFRLFGPCIVSTFLVMLLMQAGWLYQPASTLSAQFWAWTSAIFHAITWPWAWDFDLRPAYDVHLWTIPIEFAHSMLLFMVILMLARLRQSARQAGVFALMIYCLACGKWAGFEFLGGLFLAEMHILQSSSLKAWESSESPDLAAYPPPRPALLSLARQAACVALLLAAGFVGGWPNFGAAETPGIRALLLRTPDPWAHMDELAPQKFWFALSALAAVWACGELGPVRRFLEGAPAQYCGRVSYAVYMVHGPVLGLFQDCVVGHVFVPAAGGENPAAPGYRPAMVPTGVKGVFGVDTPVQRTMSWLVSLLVLGPVVIWVADVFWRAVDVPMIHMARNIEAACLDDAGQTDRGPRCQGYLVAA